MSKKSTIQDFVELPGGGKLYLLPVSEADIQAIMIATKKEYAAQGKPVEPPTYTTDAGETFVWDKDSVEKDGTDDDKAAWSAHVLASDEWTTEGERRTMLHIIVEGTLKYVTPRGSVVDLIIDEVEGQWSPPAAWLEKQKRIGYVLPDSPYDRKYDFVSSIIKGVAAQRDVVSRAMALSLRDVVTDEGLAAYEATFRRQMEQVAGKTEKELITVLERLDGVAENGTGETGGQ